MGSPMVLAKVGDVAMAAPAAERAFEPNSFEELYRFSKILVASRMLPKHLSTPEACFAVIAAGRELGLTALQSTRALYFVEGKVTLSADLMVALVKRHPDCEYFRVVEATNERCVVETKRAGEGPTRMQWTIEDAQRAGLAGKNNWKSYPKAMLRARVSADICRAVYPDATMGIYDPDELAREPKVEKVGSASVVERVVVPDPVVDASEGAADDERGPALIAQAFAQRIQEVTTLAELVDIKAEVKRAGLPEILRMQISSEYTAKQKALRGPETAQPEVTA